METDREYRLRWQYPGGSGRTRYFTREHFARKALARYQAKGYEASLDVREVLELTPWAPWSETAAVATCSGCGDSLELVGADWRTVGADFTFCTEDADSPRHSPGLSDR